MTITEAIVQGLRMCIADHGPITKEWLGSAAKRVASKLREVEHLVAEVHRVPAAEKAAGGTSSYSGSFVVDEGEWHYPPPGKRWYRVCVRLVPEDAGGFSVYCPRLPGCVSQGETEAEALANIEDALVGCLEVYLKDCGTIPWRELTEKPVGELERWLKVEVADVSNH